MRTEFKVTLKQARTAYRRRDKAKFKNEPQLRQFLILAYQIRNIRRKNPQRTLQEISEWLGLSRGRISQILNLLFLASKIQEQIILSDEKTLFSIPEHKVRPLIKKLNWDRQKEFWASLIRST